MKPMLILLTCIATLTGCASTTIERRPDGSFRYTSTRDSNVDELHLSRNETTGELELHVNGASGQASTVVDSQTQLLQQIFEAAFAAGARSTFPID